MIHAVRSGSGRKLLLIHGLGGSQRSWGPIVHALSAEREVIAIDLPGHGASPPEPDSGTFAGLVGSVQRFITESGLAGVDLVGSSMGARIVLEFARRGSCGNVLALDPGGFWRGWERTYFKVTIRASVRLLRALRPTLPALSRNAASRTALLAQLSARPWALDPNLVATELKSFATTPTFDALVSDLAHGPEQEGSAATPENRITVGWGRQDRLCLPGQAARAKAAFPAAELHWFDQCGHFPMWDQPAETIQLILARTGLPQMRGDHLTSRTGRQIERSRAATSRESRTNAGWNASGSGSRQEQTLGAPDRGGRKFGAVASRPSPFDAGPIGRAHMADDNTKRGGQDRSRVSGEQPYEVGYFARKHGITREQAQGLIEKVGANRAKLNAEAEKLAAKKKQRQTSGV